MEIIKLSNVSKQFKGLPIFENVSISFEKGKAYGIVGPNGSGKSVLFKLICQFVNPDIGKIFIAPEYMDSKSTFPSKFGIIIDRPSFIPTLTGFENLKELAKIQNKITDQDIMDTMELVGIDPTIKQKMKNYSLGMKQKIALCQAIMEKQEVLILDEPFNGLDRSSVERVRTLLLELKKQGRTIILTSHNHEDIEIICDKQYCIESYNIEKI